METRQKNKRNVWRLQSSRLASASIWGLLWGLAGLLLGLAQPTAAKTRDRVPGSYYFFDLALAGISNDPNDSAGVGQAQLVEAQGKVELLTFKGTNDYYLRYAPEKPGDSITFRFRIAQADTRRLIKVKTVLLHLNDPGQGTYAFYVNRQATGPSHDCNQQGEWKHGDFPIQPGIYTVTYRYLGRNPKSSASFLNLIRLELG